MTRSMMLNCRHCGSTLTNQSYSRVFCSIQCYCADSYRKEPKVETTTEVERLRAEVEQLREAVRTVRALAEAAVVGTAVGAWLQVQEIHKITKGMVE